MTRLAAFVKKFAVIPANIGRRERHGRRGRIEAAIDATKHVVKRLGAGCKEARLLVRSRRICVHLPELQLIARLRVDDSAAEVAGLERELAVARHLSARGAPIAPPATRLPAGPHSADGFVLSLWPFVAHRPLDPDDAIEVAAAREALERVHAALADYPQQLPSWKKDRIAECGTLLDDVHAFLALHGLLSKELDRYAIEAVPIHGDAHSANVLVTPSGPLWIDFDSACVGPRIWDLGTLGAEVRTHPHEIADLLALVRSLCVSTWCWALSDIAEKRVAAAYHLDYLKTRWSAPDFPFRGDAERG